MSEDFLSDVSEAVDNSTATSLTTPVTNEPKEPAPTTPTVLRDKGTDEATVNSLNELFDGPVPSESEIETPAVDNQTSKESSTAETEVGEETPREKSQEEILAAEDEKRKAEQEQRQPRKINDKALDTYLKLDDAGNYFLVDPKTQEPIIIATPGIARTHWDDLKRAGRHYRDQAENLAVKHLQLGKQFKALYEQHQQITKNALNPVAAVAKETGSSELDASNMITIMKGMNTDPLNTLKGLLTLAAQNGIDVSSLGTNITVDPATIKNTVNAALEERMGPVTNYVTKQQQDQAAAQEAQNFLRQYPAARDHVEVIAQAKSQFPDMTLPEIWLNITQHLRRREEKAQEQAATNSQNTQAAPVAKAKAPARRKVAPKPVDANMSFKQIGDLVAKEMDFK